MSWLDALGWSGSALLVYSLMQARVLRFRALNLIACVVLIVFNALLITRAPLQLFQAIQTSILPNLTKNQKFVSIELYQGDSADVSKNRKLGQVVLDGLVTSYLEMTDAILAQVDAATAKRLAPADSQLLFNLAVTLAKQGKLDEAEQYLLRAVELRPNYAELTIRKRRAVQNHIKTVHVIAICNGLEAAMGALAEATVPSTKRWIPKGMEVSYTAKATSDITCIAETDPEQWTGDDPDVPVRVRGVRDDGTVFDTCEYHPDEVARIVRRGFELARDRRRSLVSVDKANVLETSRLWRETAVRSRVERPELVSRSAQVSAGVAHAGRDAVDREEERDHHR